MTTGGEGGMVVSNNPELIKKLMIISHEGEIDNSGESTTLRKGTLATDYILAGHNYRFNAMQAAIGLAQLKKLNKFIKKRKEIAKKYNKATLEWTERGREIVTD